MPNRASQSVSVTVLLDNQVAPHSTHKVVLLLWPSVKWEPSSLTQGCPGSNEGPRGLPGVSLLLD